MGENLGSVIPWLGQNRDPHPAGRTGSESLVPPRWEQGCPGLPSGSDRRPLEPEFFLEGVQLVQSWLGPGALVGVKGSY